VVVYISSIPELRTYRTPFHAFSGTRSVPNGRFGHNEGRIAAQIEQQNVFLCVFLRFICICRNIFVFFHFSKIQKFRMFCDILAWQPTFQTSGL
jgi:hypothetical protein